MTLANEAAAEHLVVETEDMAAQVRCAGSLFVGAMVGAGGRRLCHRLQPRAADGRHGARARRAVGRRFRPTGHRAASDCGRACTRIGNSVVALAYAEGLTAHAESVALRLRSK